MVGKTHFKDKNCSEDKTAAGFFFYGGFS